MIPKAADLNHPIIGLQIKSKTNKQYHRKDIIMPGEDLLIREQTLQVQRDIVDLEWIMFTGVHGGGGRNFTEDEQRAFATMRLAQFSSWEKFPLDSYINDLRTALDANRNMFAEKYYYMIEETDPETFIKAKPFLPIIDDTSRELIDLITDQYRIWEKELAAVFPRVVNAALPMDNMTEGADKSYTHYLNCEIKTYSKKTLTMLYSSLVAFPEKNRYRMSLEYLMKAYGFASLEEAEKAMTR